MSANNGRSESAPTINFNLVERRGRHSLQNRAVNIIKGRPMAVPTEMQIDHGRIISAPTKRCINLIKQEVPSSDLKLIALQEVRRLRRLVIGVKLPSACKKAAVQEYSSLFRYSEFRQWLKLLVKVSLDHVELIIKCLWDVTALSLDVLVIVSSHLSDLLLPLVLVYCKESLESRG